MQPPLTFHLTDEDITEARRYGFQSELLYLLSNRTKTLWRLSAPDAAEEIMAPFRSARFYTPTDPAWQTYQGERPLPPQMRVDIEPLQA